MQGRVEALAGLGEAGDSDDMQTTVRQEAA